MTAGLAQAAQPGPAASGAAGAGDEGEDTGSHSGLDNHTEIGDTAMFWGVFLLLCFVHIHVCMFSR